MMMVCEQCGDEGLSIALVYCRNCRDSAVHRYCLSVLPENLRESVTWFCEDCVPKVGKQNPLYKPMPVLARPNDFKRLRTVKGAQSVSRLKKKASEEVHCRLKRRIDGALLSEGRTEKMRDINGILLSKSRIDRTCHNREVDCCENLELHNNCRTWRELNGKSCAEEAVLVKRSISRAAADDVPEKMNSPQVSEEAVSEKTTSPQAVEEAVSEKITSPQAVEEAVSEKITSPEAVEEAISDKTNSSQAAEEAMSEKMNSPQASEKAVSEKTNSPLAVEEAVSEKIISPQAAEEAVPEKTNSSHAAEVAVPVKTNFPHAADCGGSMGSSELGRDAFYGENDNNGRKRRRCVGLDGNVRDEPMVDVHCKDIVEVHCHEMEEKDHKRSKGSSDRFSGEAHSIEAKPSLTSTSYHPNIFQQTRFTRAEPLFPPIWNGSMRFHSGTYGNVGLVAHLSTLTLGSAKVVDEAKLLSAMLSMEVLPSHSVWPKSFENWGPIDHNIAIFIFPDSEKEEKVYDRLVDDMINSDLAMRTEVKNAELLVFTSKKLPSHYWRVQSKFYLWGVFRGKQSPPLSNAIIPSGVSNAIIPSSGEKMPQQTFQSFRNPVEMGGHTQYLWHHWKRRHIDYSWYGTARETQTTETVFYQDKVMNQHSVTNRMHGGNSMVFNGNMHPDQFEVAHQEAAKDSKQPPATFPRQNHSPSGNGGLCNVNNESVVIKKKRRRGKRGGSKNKKGNAGNNGAVGDKNKEDKGAEKIIGVAGNKNKGHKGAEKIKNKDMMRCFSCGQFGHFARECKLKWV